MFAEKRQTMLFSATQTRNVEDLARISLKEAPLYVGVDDNKETATVEGLEQVGSLSWIFFFFVCVCVCLFITRQVISNSGYSQNLICSKLTPWFMSEDCRCSLREIQSEAFIATLNSVMGHRIRQSSGTVQPDNTSLTELRDVGYTSRISSWLSKEILQHQLPVLTILSSK